MSQNIVVVAEVRSGTLKRVSLETITAAAELAAQCGGQVIALAAGDNLDAASGELSKSGAHKVVALSAPALGQFSGDGFAKVLVEEIRAQDPAAVLMPHTAMAKDLFPRLGAALDTGLLTDVTALHFENGKFGATRPTYGGKVLLKAFATRAPFMATIRPNNFEAKSDGAAAEVETKAPSISVEELKAVVKEVVAASSDRVPLQEASVIVSGGRGMKGPEHFHLVEELAAAFGPGVAAVGASRAVVDAGWREHREQVGQTGKVVSPPLYIACGISGAIQHLAGMRTSRCIVAINKDPEAPIFKVADYGIVGDVFEVMPALTEAIQQTVAAS